MRWNLLHRFAGLVPDPSTSLPAFEHDTVESIDGTPVKIRHSKQVKHLRLVIDRQGQPQLKIPVRARLNRRQIHAFLLQHAAWLKKHARPAVSAYVLPEQLFLPCVQAFYQHQSLNQEAGISAETSPDLREVHTLKNGIRQIIAPVLQEKVALRAEEMSVQINQVKLRHTRSRWGSCSATGNISLSSSLAFVTPELLDYVIVHELAHRVHFNHGPAFWALVARYCPEYARYRKQLAAVQLPDWWQAV